MILRIFLGCFLMSFTAFTAVPVSLHAESAAFAGTEETFLAACNQPGCPCKRGGRCRPA